MMKDRFVRAALVLTLGLAPLAASAQADDFVNGLVTKIDGSAEKITIKHGPIKKFDMEPMTMVFRVADPVTGCVSCPSASTASSRSRRSKKPSENRTGQGTVTTACRPLGSLRDVIGPQR